NEALRLLVPVHAEEAAVTPDKVADAKPNKAKAAAKARQLQAKMTEFVDLEDGIPPNTTVGDALEYLGKKFDLEFVVDEDAFKAIEVAKAKEQTVELPKLKGIRLGAVLRLLFGQVRGNRYTGTYVVRESVIEVTTTYNQIAEAVGAEALGVNGL